MKAMFGFLTPQGRETTDPLQNAKTAAAWLRQLPALDVIGRQQHVIGALDAMRKTQRNIDLSRVGAIEFVDAALGSDRRQLIKQYIENAEASPKLAERIWQALWEMSQAFMLAYQSALEDAVTQADNARWRAALPLLFVRLVHFHGTDAKMRVFKYERWIPAKWIELHQTYLRACEMHCDRQAMALPAAGSAAQPWSVEQEYLYVLLVHQLNTGNLSPTEIDWASSQLRAWSRRLSLEQIPKSMDGFFVDLAGREGMVRRTGNDRGSMLRYLDTSPLSEGMQRAINALRDAEMTDQGPVAVINQQRLGVLRKIQRVAQRLRRAAAHRHRGKIENGKGNHRLTACRQMLQFWEHLFDNQGLPTDARQFTCCTGASMNLQNIGVVHNLAAHEGKH